MKPPKVTGNCPNTPLEGYPLLYKKFVILPFLYDFRINSQAIYASFIEGVFTHLILYMAGSKGTFRKKEIEKKKIQKRKEKAQRREERKANEGSSFEDMIVYTDENGNFTSTPPDPTKRKEVKEEDMIIGAANAGTDEEEETEKVRTGRVTFFNTSKGYGFIRDAKTGDSIFVHGSGLLCDIMENDLVTFETEHGPRGLNAIKVNLLE